MMEGTQNIEIDTLILFVARYAEYKKWKLSKTSTGQTSLTTFINVGHAVYNSGHPRQVAITQSIIQQLIDAARYPEATITT